MFLRSEGYWFESPQGEEILEPTFAISECYNYCYYKKGWPLQPYFWVKTGMSAMPCAGLSGRIYTSPYGDIAMCYIGVWHATAI